MQYAPTRVRAKFGGFHISTPGYTKNAPGFTLPNKDIPKTRPVLGPNLWRGFFRGVCFCALHGYMKNLAGFIFPHTDTPKTHPVLGLNLRRGTFRGVCNTPLHGYMKNLTSFIFPYLNTSKTRPILPFPIGIRPKPTQFHILPPRYAKILLDFRPKPLARNISGRMQYAPTRVREKFGGFHIPAHDIA